MVPGSVHLSAEVHNKDPIANHQLTPLTGLEGAFSRGRLLSGMVLEDVLEYARVGQIFHKIEPLPAQQEIRKLGFGVANEAQPQPEITPWKKTPPISQGSSKECGTSQSSAC